MNTNCKITAYVGAGGKTTAIFRRADYLKDQGKKVFVTTTTHMYNDPNCITSCDKAEILKALEEGFAFAGSPEGEKIGPLPEVLFKEICEHADEVLIEADGSKKLPLKFPAEWEPVIPENTDEIVIVCGLNALGGRIKDTVHRSELACEKFVLNPDDTVTAEIIEKLVYEGYVNTMKENFPDAEIKILPTHTDTLYKRVVSALLSSGRPVSLIKESWFENSSSLFICGGGHISRALAKAAVSLDFKITVMDDRAEILDKNEFPDGTRLICDSFEKLGKYINCGDYCVVATRGHSSDYCCVSQILGSGFSYLGMLGSKKKTAEILSKLEEAGYSQEELACIHAPIGFKIGAQTPAEIAISILAEIISEKHSAGRGSASRELLNSDKHGTLCIITEKHGSAPRGEGAMMLVCEDEVIDTIGGGLIEYKVIEEARKSQIVHEATYSLAMNNNGGLDMYCGGSIKILFIPV